MDIQILCAFLLQNQSFNQFVHVIGPLMTKKMQELYDEKIKLDSIPMYLVTSTSMCMMTTLLAGV